MLVTVTWSEVQGDDDPQWTNNCGLYAYLTPDWQEILYIGKVDGCTVRRRWNAPDKTAFWRDLERKRQIFKHILIFGEIELDVTDVFTPRLTRQKIADIESLLIHEVQPWGNVAAKSSRISRTGMIVTCAGTWPLEERIYLDFG